MSKALTRTNGVPLTTAQTGDILATPMGVSWEDAERVFLASLAGKRTDRTRALYKESLGHFRAWAEGRGIATVTALVPAHLVGYREAWQALLDAGKYKPATVGNRLVAVRRFLLRCLTEGFLQPGMTRERIATYLESPQDKRLGKLPEYLERDEITTLLGTIQATRDKAIFTLALGSGLRVSELVALRVGDLRPLPKGGAILEVREGKGGKARSFAIPPEVFTPVREWAEADGRSWRREKDKETWLFPGNNGDHLARQRVFQLLASYVHAAGLQKPVHPHSLRHTFATHYMAEGGNPVALAEILGHANLNYIMVYAHLGNMLREEGYKAPWVV
jgi:site-specific recombinase XerD